jgi:hypothetical protein
MVRVRGIGIAGSVIILAVVGPLLGFWFGGFQSYL